MIRKSKNFPLQVSKVQVDVFGLLVWSKYLVYNNIKQIKTANPHIGGAGISKCLAVLVHKFPKRLID